MNREELIQELKWALPSNEIKNVISYGEVKINGEVIVLKNRFGDDYVPQDVYEYSKDYNGFIEDDLKDLQGKSVSFSLHTFSLRGLLAMYKYVESNKKEIEKIVIEGVPSHNILEGADVAHLTDDKDVDLDEELLKLTDKRVRVTIEVLS